MYKEKKKNKLNEEIEEYNVWRTFTRGNILRKRGDKTLYLIEKATKEYLFVVTDTGERKIFSTKEYFRRPQGNNFSQSTPSQQSYISFLEKNTDSEYNANTNPERQFYISWAKNQNEKSVEKIVIHDENILNSMEIGDYNDNVLEYIYYLTDKEICQCLAERIEGFIGALLTLVIKYGDFFGVEILKKIEETYKTYTPKNIENNDFWKNYALFMFHVINLSDKNTILYTKVAASRILNFAAKYKKCDFAKECIDKLKRDGKLKNIESIFQ